MTALHRAENPAVAKALLDHGADISARSNDGWTPLRTAVIYSASGELVRYLVEQGPDIQDTIDRGSIVDEAAGLSCKPELLKIRLELGADVSKANNFGRTLLSESIKYKKQDCVDIIDGYLKKRQ